VRQVSKTSAPFFAQKALPETMARAVLEEACGPFHAQADRLTIDVLRDLTDDLELIAVLCANWGTTAWSRPKARSRCTACWPSIT
jgi:all-trans-retinol 13,14-reductase